MLLIGLRNDGGLTLTSDDKNAENQVVADLFSGGVTDDDWDLDDPELFSGDIPPVDYEVLIAWERAPFSNGKLVVEFAPQHTEEILEALANLWPEAGDLLDKIYEEKRAANPPRPKPGH